MADLQHVVLTADRWRFGWLPWGEHRLESSKGLSRSRVVATNPALSVPISNATPRSPRYQLSSKRSFRRELDADQEGRNFSTAAIKSLRAYGFARKSSKPASSLRWRSLI